MHAASPMEKEAVVDWALSVPIPEGDARETEFAREDDEIVEECGIEDYIDVEQVARTTFVLVKWEGHPKEEATWENTEGEHLRGTDEVRRESRVRTMEGRKAKKSKTKNVYGSKWIKATNQYASHSRHYCCYHYIILSDCNYTLTRSGMWISQMCP